MRVSLQGADTDFVRTRNRNVDKFLPELEKGDWSTILQHLSKGL